MRQFQLVFLILASLAINFVYGDQHIESSPIDKHTEKADENISSVKTKRGIFNYAIPYGHNYLSYTPYAKFPGIYKGLNTPSYALTPGNAVVHSYNVNYPKIYVSKPAFRPSIPPPIVVHSKPILPVHSIPIYAKRFPVFVQKSVLVHRPVIPTPFVPQFTVPPFIPAAPSHIHPLHPISISNAIPQSTLISQDGWKPVSPPPVTILPPFTASNSHSQLTGPDVSHTPNNYYLPPDSSFHAVSAQPQTLNNNGLSHANDQYQHQHQHHELHAHLQHLQHIQQIQSNQHFLRNEQSEIVSPLSEQGYETASNNGRYSGPSSYEVQLSSRG